MRASVVDPARFIDGTSRVSSATVGVSDVPLSVWRAKLSQTCKYEFGTMNCEATSAETGFTATVVLPYKIDHSNIAT